MEFCSMCAFLKDNWQAQVVVLLTQFLQKQACSLEQGACHDCSLRISHSIFSEESLCTSV